MHRSIRLNDVGCQRRFIRTQIAFLGGVLISLPFIVIPLAAQDAPQTASPPSSSVPSQAFASHPEWSAERPGSDVLAYW
jgi:hypothetical protein